jgi:hypothetical protein
MREEWLRWRRSAMTSTLAARTIASRTRKGAQFSYHLMGQVPARLARPVPAPALSTPGVR